MHLFGVAFIVSGILFAIFQQRALIAYFLLTIAVYIGISMVLKGSKSISNRKKIMVATWQNPGEGVIQLKVPCRTEKIQEIVKKSAGTQQKLTITHFAIKAIGQLFASSPDLNGKLVFGKFVQHDTIDISCLVDIDGGKDLALILVKEVDKKSVKQIASFIKQKGSTIKKGKGDIDHKKRTRVADFLPSFLVAVMIHIARFITNKLGLNFKALGLTRHQFGAGCVTSLGMLNFEDATAPFSGFTDCTMLLSVNAIRDEPVIQDGKVVPGRVINCNFVVDHRYVDGGRAKNLVSIFRHVFEHPELYLDSSGPTQAEIKKQKQA